VPHYDRFIPSKTIKVGFIDKPHNAKLFLRYWMWFFLDYKQPSGNFEDRIMKRLLLGTVSVCFFISVNLASAATTYSYSGVITTSYDYLAYNVPYPDGYSRLYEGVETGTPFTGRFTYDPSMYNSHGEIDIYAERRGSGFSIAVNDLNIDIGGDYFRIGRSGDQLSGIQLTAVTDSGVRMFESTRLTFGQVSHGIDSINLPLKLPETLFNAEMSFRIHGLEDSPSVYHEWELSGEIINISVVPIPSSIWLLGSGLLGILGIAHLKKSAYGLFSTSHVRANTLFTKLPLWKRGDRGELVS
jgi:hypothetical protein